MSAVNVSDVEQYAVGNRWVAFSALRNGIFVGDGC